MPQTIDIPDVGQVQFPDSMGDHEIVDAIQAKILPDFRARQLKRSSLVAEQQALAAKPEPSLTSLVGEELSNNPLVTAYNKGSAQQAENLRDVGEAVTSGEVLKPAIPIPRPQTQPDDSALTQFGKGMTRAGIGVAEGIESPAGLAVIGASAIPGIGPAITKVAAGTFGIKSVLSGFQEASEAYQKGDFGKAGEALGNILLGSAMVRGAFPKNDTLTAATERAVSEAPKVDAFAPSISALPETPTAPTPDALAPSTVQASLPSAPAKWATATADESVNLGSELYAGIPNPVSVAKAVVKLAKDAAPYLKKAGESLVETTRDLGEQAKELGSDALKIGQVTDYRKAVLNWSAKLQKSFGEATDAQEEIQSKVPDKVRREGITNWIQAGGDATILAAREAATDDPKLKAGYEAARNLTPEEIAVAKDVKSAFDALGQRGHAFDVVGDFIDNYVTQIWDMGKGPAMGSSRTLKENFRFSKARTFESFFDGEQADYKPKTKDISELLPVYLHEMNSVIAGRQLVQEMSKGVGEDGRPLVAPKGIGIPVDDDGGSATLVVPKVSKPEMSDYRTLENQPALNAWKWVSKDDAGNPVFLKAELALHPEAYARLKNVLGKSAIKEWYSSKTSVLAEFPKAFVRLLDRAQSETKKTLLGLFSTFHQVQEGTHAIGHWVSPFSNIPKIDLVNDVSQMDAARHGLMLLPDRASANQFMEGFKVSGLIAKLPVIGPIADAYADYLFTEYIPGLKYKTYEAILGRNKKVYAPELARSEVSEADVKVLSAEQANAAYGHLNYADLARNPTVQHLLQWALLAPDFLEARGRFAAQAATGTIGMKVGREQTLALGRLALAQSATAYTLANLTGGEWDKEDPFAFRVGNRKYTMRSVPEDIAKLLQDPRQFWSNRLNPLIGTILREGLYGVDWQGHKVTPAEAVADIARTPVPLSLKAFLGSNKSSLSTVEQLAGTVGFRISRYDPYNDLRKAIVTFKQNSSDPKIQAEAERAEKESLVSSDYSDLRHALSDNKPKEAKQAYDKLLETKTPKQIDAALKPNKPITGSKKIEQPFVDSLDDRQKRLYEDVMRNREVIYQRYHLMITTDDPPERNAFSIRK